MYAVIRTGGKQYRVEAGQRLLTERLPGDEGDTIEFADVLMIGDSNGVTIGTPLVSDARVVAEIVAQGRHKPVSVFKYKNKIRYRRLHRHRQLQTTLSIQEILPPGAGRPLRRRTTKIADSAPQAETTGAATDTDADLIQSVAAVEDVVDQNVIDGTPSGDSAAESED